MQPGKGGVFVVLRRPIGNRIHFHDDSIRTPWFGDRSTRFKIGPMVFFNPK